MSHVKVKKSIVSILAVILLFVGVGASNADSLTFGDFETSIPVINPAGDTDSTSKLWSQYSGGDFTGTYSETGDVAISTEKSNLLEHSAKVGVDDGGAYFQFYPYKGYEWHYLREIIKEDMNVGEWKLNTFNRMEFFVYVPSGLTPSGPGQFNMAVGTYVRSTTGDRASAEAGGNHYYHRYNLPASEGWHKVVVDMHPTHERGENGGKEHGLQEHPTGEDAYNYFDTLTRFYVDFEGSHVPSGSSAWFFDGFRVYNETALENVQQVYSLHGSYTAGETPRLIVGWNRNKDENSVSHEVRYSFEDIHNVGWDNATVAPGTPLSPQGWQGYNGMLYETSAINAAGNDVIYVAIKPENSSLFRQISIPVGQGSLLNPPKQTTLFFK